MNEQKFKVIGEESLLKDCKINLFIIDEKGNKKRLTLLNNGVLKEIVPETEIAEFYTIYASHQNKYINVMEFENIFRNANDQISHFYISKINGVVSILFVGREAEIKKKRGFETVLIPVEDYFKKNKIENEEFISKEKKLFFDSY